VSRSDVEVPMTVRIMFGHAALQVVADAVGVDVLHIKGPATDPDLQSAGGGTDADVLVRPSQCEAFLLAMTTRDWQRRNTFRSGSPFGHAATYWHAQWGYADIHRFFPGMGQGEQTFDLLWAEREVREFAGIPAAVPSAAARHLVAVLNAARNRRPLPPDTQAADAARALVPRLEAGVGWAAAHGRLQEHRDAPDYALWKVTVEGGTRTQEWWARVKAAPTRRDKVALVLRAPLVNVDHLANVRGHRPTAREIAVEFFDRPRRGLAEEWQRRTGRGSR
jgi:hypothetical protein